MAEDRAATFVTRDSGMLTQACRVGTPLARLCPPYGDFSVPVVFFTNVP